MKKIMILDTEGLSTCRPYNLGWIIADKKGNIYAKASLAIIPCIYENLRNPQRIAEEMTTSNIEEILLDYENSIENRKYTYQSIEEAKKKFLSILIEHEVKEIWAYNCPFDKGAMHRLFGNDWEMVNSLVTFYDIIPAILHTKLLTKKYINFCIENGYTTDKGNVKYSAEIVWRYLTDNIEYMEEHTALSDVLMEYQIFLTAYETKKKHEFDRVIPPWKILKNFCEANEITIPKKEKGE